MPSAYVVASARTVGRFAGVDNAGRRTSLTYPNGVVTSYGYDNANRLLSIDHIKTPSTIEALTYLNDAAGNRVKLTRANAANSDRCVF